MAPGGIAVGLAALTLALSGCGGSSGDGPHEDPNGVDGNRTTSTTPTTLTTPMPSEPRRPLRLNTLHHNPHWECSADATCKHHAWDQFNGFLDKYDVDFASLIMGGNYKPPQGWRSKAAVSFLDKAALVWDDKKWRLRKSKHTEFMQDRAVMLARFTSREDERVALVVGSLHYPHGDIGSHPESVGNAIKALCRAIDGPCKVLLMSDTNENAVPFQKARGISSKQLVRNLGLDFETVETTAAIGTCCADARPYQLTYDRIFTNFACELETVLDKTYVELTANYTDTPSWAEAVKKPHSKTIMTAAYHHPIMAKLTVPVEETELIV